MVWRAKVRGAAACARPVGEGGGGGGGPAAAASRPGRRRPRGHSASPWLGPGPRAAVRAADAPGGSGDVQPPRALAHHCPPVPPGLRLALPTLPPHPCPEDPTGLAVAAVSLSLLRSLLPEFSRHISAAAFCRSHPQDSALSSRVRRRGLAHPHSSAGGAGGALPAPVSCSPPTAGRLPQAPAGSGLRPLPAERNCTRGSTPPGARSPVAWCACPACCQPAPRVGEGGQEGGASLSPACSLAAYPRPHRLGTLLVF